MKKCFYALSLILMTGLSAALYASHPAVSADSALLTASSLINSDTEIVQIAHRPHGPVVVMPRRGPVVVVPPRPPVVVPPRPVVVVPPRPPVVVPPRPVVVVPPQPVVVIPNYGYGWWNNTYVPCYNNWYWYNGAWVWGGRGPRPVPPRWVPDFRRRPMPPAPPRPGYRHPAPRHGSPRHYR